MKIATKKAKKPLTAQDKVLIAMYAGCVIEAYKAGPFAATKYELRERQRDENGEIMSVDRGVVAEASVRMLAAKGYLDTSDAKRTWTENATRYTITLTPKGQEAAHAVDVRASEADA
jgi:DNA-binding PadR family transcriptional regulator